MSRRVSFFAIAALACAVLTLAAPADLRWVPEIVAVVYGILASLTALEEWSTSRHHRGEP
jgi:hypothetical protein